MGEMPIEARDKKRIIFRASYDEIFNDNITAKKYYLHTNYIYL